MRTEVGILRLKYRGQKTRAFERGIAFLLSFDEWLEIWVKSGRLLSRGRRRDEYCMARFGDVGPYAIGNVEIITNWLNASRASKGRKLSEEHKRKIGAASKGKLVTPFKLTPMQVSTSKLLHAQGLTQREIAEKFGVHQATISRNMRGLR